MPNISKVKRCYHCGAILQETDPNKPGYISSVVVNKYSDDALLLCDACYKSEKQEIPQEVLIDTDYYEILNQIKDKNALVVYVVDLFSFEGSFISDVNEKLHGCDVLAIGNKRDLFPENINDDDLIEYVEHRLRVAKLDVKDVVLTSTQGEGYNIDLMYKKIKKLGKGKDVYFVGASISGKSMLIQELLKNYDNKTNEFIITYTFPNTKLRGFKIPLGNQHYIYEMPGLPIDNSLISKMDFSVSKKIIPTKPLVARNYKLNKNASIMFGGLALIELIEGEQTNINVYCSKQVELKTAKLGEEKFQNVLVKHSLKPCYEKLKTFADFDVYDLAIQENGDRDLGILGLGWFHFTGSKQTFRVFVPKGVYVYTTRSKIK